MIRELTNLEIQNFEFIKAHYNDATVIILTETGLHKSIMDATFEVRLFLKSHNIHDYHLQKQGQNHKVIVSSYFCNDEGFHEMKASLYRPKTKNGDPRIWFTGLKKYVNSSCALSLIEFKNSIYVINISNSKLFSSIFQNAKVIEFFQYLREDEESVAYELLEKLKSIHHRGWIPATAKGDTAVGKTLEDLLGIKRNSSKNPDYKGIEIKSYRKGKKSKNSRSTLFGQVADWSISNIKSSKEMLDKYGYFRNGKKRLNCTISTLVSNSQGLSFETNDSKELLIEVAKINGKKENCLMWPYQLLIERLLEKHSETFWIEAEVRLRKDGTEEFLYIKVTHTKRPYLNQLIPLIRLGTITMDHVISKPAKSSVVEKGPLFKINLKNLHLIFPEPNVIFLKDL